MPTQTPPKTNLTREAFFLVRENPGITRAEAIKRLDDMGFKRDSTSSILSQLVRSKMVDMDENDRLSTKRVVYTSLTHALAKAPKKRRKLKTKVQKPKAVELKDVRSPAGFVGTPLKFDAAPEPQATPTPQRVSGEISMTVEEFLDKVPLSVARNLYTHLHNIFGGQTL